MTTNDVNSTGTPTGATGPAPEAVSPVPPTPPTPEAIADLTERAAKAQDSWDRYLRAVADLDNYRKRAARERTEAVQLANEGLLRKLLPVLDNLDMALAAPVGQDTSAASFRTGFSMISSQLRQAITEAGIEEIDASGQAFDPNLHEAVSQLESADVPEGHVLHQIRKGYRLQGRLLRPASVVVARPPAS